MKCPKCQGLTLVRPITGHKSPFDEATGVTTRTRVCKSTTCNTVFKTYERIDVDDAELRRQAFLYGIYVMRLQRARASVEKLKAAIEREVAEIDLP